MADNEGLTPTHRLKTDSDALDGGSNALAVQPFTTDALPADQRGFSRFVDDFSLQPHPGQVDIGAYEYGLIVTETTDISNSNFDRDDLTLREALTMAFLVDGVNQIEFDPDVFAGGNTIVLTGGELIVDSDVEIIGLGADRLTIDAESSPYGFRVASGSTLAKFRGFHLTDADGAAIYHAGGSYPDVLVEGLDITANGKGIEFGGGGTLTVRYTDISDNAGFGINHVYAGPLLVEESTIADNGGHGIGVAFSSAVINNTTVSNNVTTGNVGGVVVSYASATLRNSTVAYNRADVDVVGGGATGTGGILANVGGGVTLLNTIVSDNWAGAPAQGDVPADVGEAPSGGYGGPGNFLSSSTNNLIKHDPNNYFTGTGNITGVSDAGLAALDYYGGRTRTHALELGSPAIDHGSDLSAASLATDQRGFQRVIDDAGTVDGGGGSVDIGAFEYMAPILVSTLNDESDGNHEDGDLSLREALELSADIPERNSIVFDPFALAESNTISLTGGELTVDSDVEVLGPGATWLTVDGQYQTPHVFTVNQGTNVTISGLTITRGWHATSGGYGGNGGGIFSKGNLKILDSEIVSNRANGSGAGIHHSIGTLEIHSSLLYDNHNSLGVGGLDVQSSPSVLITNTTISDNRAAYGFGGASINADEATLIHVTITDNSVSLQSSSNAGGLAVGTSGNVTLHNTIVAGNLAGGNAADFSGSPDVSSSHNLIGVVTSGAGPTDPSNNIIGISDPMLGVLQDNGGPTKTHALENGSQAIDNGSKDVAFEYDLFGDQRGFNRFARDVFGNTFPKPDIGAFELAFDEFF